MPTLGPPDLELEKQSLHWGTTFSGNRFLMSRTIPCTDGLQSGGLQSGATNVGSCRPLTRLEANNLESAVPGNRFWNPQTIHCTGGLQSGRPKSGSIQSRATDFGSCKPVTTLMGYSLGTWKREPTIASDRVWTPQTTHCTGDVESGGLKCWATDFDPARHSLDWGPVFQVPTV